MEGEGGVVGLWVGGLWRGGGLFANLSIAGEASNLSSTKKKQLINHNSSSRS